MLQALRNDTMWQRRWPRRVRYVQCSLHSWEIESKISIVDRLQTAGYRGDIGYQSFLYSNVTEVRRVFMFLIERLPKDVDKDQLDDANADRKTIVEHELRQNIKIQLNAVWTPQYCKRYGARKFGNLIAIQASNHGFLPQHLNIPYATLNTQSNSKWQCDESQFSLPNTSTQLILVSFQPQ